MSEDAVQGIAEQLEQKARRRLDKCLMRLCGRASPAATAHLKTIAPKRVRRIGSAEGCSGKWKLIDRGLFPASAI
jgi:hypothetical protein